PKGHPNSRPPLKATMPEITSRDNRWLKRFRSALAGDGDGCIGVEGVRLVEAALGSSMPVEAVLLGESGEKHLAKLAGLLDGKSAVLRTSDRLFSGVADTQTPQGIAALLRPPAWTVPDLLRGMPLIIFLVGVQDPGNVGTILRAAEAFGATGAVASSAGVLGTADPFSPKALRASAGSALRLPIVRDSEGTLLAQLRKSGVRLCATVPDAGGASVNRSESSMTPQNPPAARPWEIDWKTPLALLIGNEGAGLPDDILHASDFRVTIPQATAKTRVGVESLNAAMAATALLYEAMRQRTESERSRK
ncbi:MAG: TrmH family RNA methyltransferase, partial [Bryobacteraceae bacterium]